MTLQILFLFILIHSAFNGQGFSSVCSLAGARPAEKRRSRAAASVGTGVIGGAHGACGQCADCQCLRLRDIKHHPRQHRPVGASMSVAKLGCWQAVKAFARALTAGGRALVLAWRAPISRQYWHSSLPPTLLQLPAVDVDPPCCATGVCAGWSPLSHFAKFAAPGDKRTSSETCERAACDGLHARACTCRDERALLWVLPGCQRRVRSRSHAF